jgi:hypothetical protein
MRSLADGLPPEVATRVHPAWRANEAAYWSARPGLPAQYPGQWIAFADGTVIAASPSPVEVLQAAQASARHPFVIRVGAEDEPTRMRRVVFTYDTSYPNEPLPRLAAEFRSVSGTLGLLLDEVIPDTGADASALPWSDCQTLQLDPAQGVPGLIGGIGRSSAATLVFLVWIHLDGQEYPCRLQADFAGDERVLGRDVLNRIEILFRGPSGEVVINP